MSEFKGTKETWFKSGLEIVSMPSQVKIAKVSGSDYEEAKANALLISKAPEMLDMLKECKRVLSSAQSPATPSILLCREIQQLIKEASEL